MRDLKWLLFSTLCLAACGPRDQCVAPVPGRSLTVQGMSLEDKANALGVPPDQVPEKPRSASSYGALMAGMSENERAQSVYESYIARKNAVMSREYCVQTEAYKARTMKDEIGGLAHAVMATCHSDDEQAALAAVLKYRNCAAGR